MPTTFIALQCFHCSTMQVKQQKKSSNKWCCVVCNQKQSVRKVYAQGFMAKDIRHFVQSFNMSRQLAEQHSTPPQSPLPLPPPAQFPVDRTKRRADWTEYLDADHEIKVEEETGGNVDMPEIVTEMPKELFKKPKLKNHYTEPGTIDSERTPRFTPFFPKRNAHKTSAAKDQESRKSQLTMGGKTSKWSDYITEDGSDLCFEGRIDSADDEGGEFVDGVLDSAVDQRVEDEIHPDFM